MLHTIEPLVLAVIMFASRVTGVPEPLLAAVIKAESSFNLHAVGGHDEDGVPKAYGPMQLHIEGAGAGWPVDSLINWQFNIMLGSDYLAGCLQAFPNNKKMAIAAYFQGIPATAYNGYGPVAGYVEKVLEFEREFAEEWARTK